MGFVVFSTYKDDMNAFEFFNDLVSYIYLTN